MKRNIVSAADLHTPVLFLIFNRPETTKRVFETIRDAKPSRLYIASDGPRAGYNDDLTNVLECRIIATQVDWRCEVRTLYRDENLGSKYAVSGAIDWFFKHEPAGIILEDDCVPSLSFFWYCQYMLQKFRDNKHVWMISGFNPKYPGLTSHRFFLSQNPAMWGWASWSDRWQHYNVEQLGWESCFTSGFENAVPNYVLEYYKKSFDLAKSGAIDAWDYQLVNLIISNSGFVIKPYCNLISNIGVLGTHASGEDRNHFIKKGEFILSNFSEYKFDYDEDLWFYRTYLRSSVLYFALRLFRKIKKLIW